jgi:hypothetical protein
MHATAPNPTEAKQLGRDAFVFGFPLLLMAGAMRGDGSSTAPEDGLGPNRFVHATRFARPDFRAIVGADPHTLYSVAWLDLSDGPVRVELPDVGDRPYLIPLLDAWSNVFASLGPRAEGSLNGACLIVNPDWSGDLPDDLRRIEAPTRHVWAICHMQAHKHDDLETARALQRGLRIAPLQGGAGVDSGDIQAESTTLSLEELDRRPHGSLMELSAERFLGELAVEMGINPPWNGDGEILARLAGIGLLPGGPFDWATLPGEVREAIEVGVETGKEEVGTPPAPEQEENGWKSFQHVRRDFGADYLRRARVANFALGLAHPEDALFPFTAVDEDGNRLNGAHRYVLRFEREDPPPVAAVWSLALYDMDQLFVSNSIDRYALGSRDELDLSPDGSVEITIQREPPPGSDANWLPTPEGDFSLMLHLYRPSESVLDGSWTIPPVRRVDQP